MSLLSYTFRDPVQAARILKITPAMAGASFLELDAPSPVGDPSRMRWCGSEWMASQNPVVGGYFLQNAHHAQPWYVPAQLFREMYRLADSPEATADHRKMVARAVGAVVGRYTDRTDHKVSSIDFTLMHDACHELLRSWTPADPTQPRSRQAVDAAIAATVAEHAGITAREHAMLLDVGHRVLRVLLQPPALATHPLEGSQPTPEPTPEPAQATTPEPTPPGVVRLVPPADGEDLAQALLDWVNARRAEGSFMASFGLACAYHDGSAGTFFRDDHRRVTLLGGVVVLMQRIGEAVYTCRDPD